MVNKFPSQGRFSLNGFPPTSLLSVSLHYALQKSEQRNVTAGDRRGERNGKSESSCVLMLAFVRIKGNYGVYVSMYKINEDRPDTSNSIKHLWAKW